MWAVDIVRDVLARIEAYDAVQPQAWIARFDAQALLAAGEAVDARIAAGEKLALAEVPPPLAIGTVTLADGSSVKGFVAEPRATVGAEDITALGGWRAYIARGPAS